MVYPSCSPEINYLSAFRRNITLLLYLSLASIAGIVNRISGPEYVDMISAVTSEDICAFVSTLLESRPSLAVFGDGVEAAKYDVLLARYGNGAALSGDTTPAGRGGVQAPPSTTSRLRTALGLSQWGSSKA